MSYSYYQANSPGGGTSQYQFGPPPPPDFQPQPTWGGMDFYRAHALTPDPSLFDYAWSRVRDHSGLGAGPIGAGVGMHEARHWHSRAYGGLGELSRMLPAEIGHAAAYEAYRTWIHNNSMYKPLGGDLHRQREGLIGLAVAEASRLLPYAGRPQENFARMAASEAAAATASIIFYEGMEDMDGYRRSRSRTRGSGSSYGDSRAYDDALAFPGYRSRSRRRSDSHSRPQVIQIRGGGGMSPMPGGYAGSSYIGQPSSYGSYSGGGMPINMPAQGTPYPQTAMPMPGAGAYPTTGMPIGVPLTGPHRGRSSSFSYPQIAQTPYMGTPMSAGGGGPHAPTTIVIQQPRKHRHHHHRRHRSSGRRARSISPYRDHYPAHYTGY
ncbi:hypothetical protein LshimejAT787_0403150 [Lyophyllum shimeji]|uniref:Uncharacterized protein n=1 Tax=Lyophyllum shimeji TaxID=47721 RepID=A0A9P3PKR7_LYOSH|nr:hypothetical protein LshimejAT787_0403150 [Lyophyllum shimeji]